MIPPDHHVGALNRRDDEPAFHEPWQAQALAIANALIHSQAISSSDWAQSLGEELSAPPLGVEKDDADAYYTAVVRALERVLTNGNMVSQTEIDRRRHEWEHAYLETPHGQPVLLKGERG